MKDKNLNNFRIQVVLRNVDPGPCRCFLCGKHFKFCCSRLAQKFQSRLSRPLLFKILSLNVNFCHEPQKCINIKLDKKKLKNLEQYPDSNLNANWDPDPNPNVLGSSTLTLFSYQVLMIYYKSLLVFFCCREFRVRGFPGTVEVSRTIR